jgi:ssDNA-binding protein
MENVMTPVFRVSYPFLFKPRLNDLSNKTEYTVVALFPKGADMSRLKNAAAKACEEKWGKDKTDWPQDLKSPFKDQGKRAKMVEGKKVLPQGYEEGAIYLDLKSAERPGIVDQNVQDILDPSEFYAGCYARATVRFFAYDHKVNKGISIGLVNLQKVKEGDSLGNRTKAVDDFSPIEGANSGSVASDLFG